MFHKTDKPKDESKKSAQTQTFSPTPQGAVQRALADPGSIRRSDVPILQKTIGNRAVQRLLEPLMPQQPQPVVQEESVAPTPAPSETLQRFYNRYQKPSQPSIQRTPTTFQRDLIQRTLIHHKPKTPSTEIEKTGYRKAKIVDNAVDTAFKEFKAGNFDGASEAQTGLYLLRKHEYDQWLGGQTTGYGMHPSTAAGYVIEGKVNTELGKHGDEEFNLQDSQLLKGTRPDIVFSLPGEQHGLVDITASNSTGHIFKKKGNWTEHESIPYVAESIYPSLDFTNLSKTQVLTEEQIQQAIQRGQESREWKEYEEAERNRLRQEAYDSYQERVLSAVENYLSAPKSSGFGSVWRLTRRDISLFEMLGFRDVVSEEGTIKEPKTITYEEWKEGTGRFIVPDSEFNALINQIETKYMFKIMHTLGSYSSEPSSSTDRRPRSKRKGERSEPYDKSKKARKTIVKKKPRKFTRKKKDY